MKCYEIIGLGSTTNRTIAYRHRTAINCFRFARQLKCIIRLVMLSGKPDMDNKFEKGEEKSEVHEQLTALLVRCNFTPRIVSQKSFRTGQI